MNKPSTKAILVPGHPWDRDLKYERIHIAGTSSDLVLSKIKALQQVGWIVWIVDQTELFGCLYRKKKNVTH